MADEDEPVVIDARSGVCSLIGRPSLIVGAFLTSVSLAGYDPLPAVIDIRISLMSRYV